MEEIFPGKGIGNVLKEWLERRRTADYDPYPDDDLSVECQNALKVTETFLEACEAFLRTAGVLT